MKYKVLALAVLTVVIYSCASKSSAPTQEVKPSEIKFVPTASATVLTPELAEGKSLYENNCANCHKLYNANEFTAEEWTPIVKRMAIKSQLDDVQGQKIYNYLTMK